MHYTKSVVYYHKTGWNDSSVEYNTCAACLKILLIKENDRLAKIAERITEVENTPPALPIIIPKLPTKPDFLWMPS